eukprot:1329915-Prymnesium_polylepis.1
MAPGLWYTRSGGVAVGGGPWSSLGDGEISPGCDLDAMAIRLIASVASWDLSWFTVFGLCPYVCTAALTCTPCRYLGSRVPSEPFLE